VVEAVICTGLAIVVLKVIGVVIISPLTAGQVPVQVLIAVPVVAL
jgi:hypothetical protein